MFAALALRPVLAAVLAAQPVAAAPAAPASEAVPVQSPTSSVPLQKPSTPVQPAAAPERARDYDGVDVLSPSPAEASPPPAEASPPAQTVPAPGVTPIASPEPELAELEGPLDEPAYDPRVDSPEAIRAKHVVNGGIAFTVVGGVLTIGGIAMSTAKVNEPGAPEQPCDGRSDRAGNGCTPGGRDRAVAALVVPGVLLLAGGVTMLVVGKLQQRRLRTTLQADKRGFMIGAALRF